MGIMRPKLERGREWPKARMEREAGPAHSGPVGPIRCVFYPDFDIGELSEQQCSVELSVMMETFCIRAVQYSSHYPHVPAAHLECG